jgi:hypothetical protein
MSDAIASKPTADVTGKHAAQKPLVLAAGTHTMATTDEDIACVGLAATDIVIVSLKTQAGSVDIAELAGIAEADNINLQATAVGDGDGVVSYVAIRP